MGWSFTLGRIAGTAVRMHVTFFLLLAWIGFSAWRSGGAAAAWNGVAFILLLFACVLAHEFGHILTARRYGIATPEVTLLPIGGVASLERLPEKPSEQLAVAVAGPAVNVVIALALFVILGLLADTTQVGHSIARVEDPNVSLLSRLAAANVFLVLFNMLPAFPMDGGRVLNAILAMRMDKRKAMRISARIGQGMALLFGFAGLAGGNPLLVFVAIFVYMAAASESYTSDVADLTDGLTVAEAMETRISTIPLEATLADAVDLMLATPQHEFPVVDAFRKPVGLLRREGLVAALREKGPEAPVADAAEEAGPSLRRFQPLTEGYEELNRRGAPAISVVDEGGAVIGLLTLQNIAEMMMIRAARPDWRFRGPAAQANRAGL